MKNVLHKKDWHTCAVKTHLDPPPMSLIKIKNNAKSKKYCVKTKLRRYHTSEKLNLYEFKWPYFLTARWRSV